MPFLCVLPVSITVLPQGAYICLPSWVGTPQGPEDLIRRWAEVSDQQKQANNHHTLDLCEGMLHSLT